MGSPLFANNASTTLAATVNTTATAVTVASGKGALFPTPTGGDYFYATLVNSSNQFEIVQCTARVGDTLTVARGQDGTAALSFAIGDKIELRPTAGALNAIAQNPVTTARLADGAVTHAKLAANAVDASNIVDGSVGAAEIAGGAVDNTKLAAGAAAANLGFTPVRQGGGYGQGSNQLNVGWTGSDLSVVVDTTAGYRIMLEKVDGSADSGGYRGLPQRVIGGNYTVVQADNGRMLFHRDSNAYTITIPNDTDMTAQAGFVVQIVNGGAAGNITIAGESGVTLIWAGSGSTGPRTLAGNAIATVQKVDPNFWYVSGTGLS